MKKVLLIISLISFTATVSGQRALTIKSGDKGLYLEHIVAPKENFYSIGRLYNVHPKHIASFNALDMNKGLTISKVIRIPLTDSNFVQNKVQGIPIYYVVREKETLMKVSNNNNKVLLENLRKWNHLSSDNLAKGQKLVVGFLSSTEMKNVAVVAPLKNDPAKVEDVMKKEARKNADEILAKKEEAEKQIVEQPKKDPDVVPVKEESKPADNSQGYFRSSFIQQVREAPAKKNQTVTSGIFKTTSGWNDAKYYLLMDGIETGTIVKITNPVNNKIIYAKVLGEMNGLAHNDGLDIRISNSAASILEISDTDKFILKLNY